MRAEFHELWHVRRPQVTQAVSEAAAQGDRSENAERTKAPHFPYYRPRKPSNPGIHK
jgi:transcription elongation factor GreB